MTKLVPVVAVLLGLGLWGQNASAGGTSLGLTFAPTGIFVDIPGNQTTVTSTLTATVMGAPGEATFTATFTNSDGFTNPGAIGPLNPTMSPGVCSPPGASFTCMVMDLDFTKPGTTPGTFIFTANGLLTDGISIPQSASFQATVPEPGALALLSLGLVALGVVWRKSAGPKSR
jgi:hypothetical protein